LIKIFRGFPAEAFRKIKNSLRNQSLSVFAFNDKPASIAWEAARNKGLENQIKFIALTD